MKAYGRTGMKIYTNEMGHMIKMAAIFFSRTNQRMAF